MNHDFPMTFDEPIRRLMTGSRSNDDRIVVRKSEIGLGGVADEFLVTVTAKAFSVTTCFGAKEIKSVTDVR